jgi:hypothetical protein
MLLAELSGRSAAARDLLAASGLAPANLGWVPAGRARLAPGLHASVRVEGMRAGCPGWPGGSRWPSCVMTLVG